MTTIAASPRHQVVHGALRLVPTAVCVWAVFALIGYEITHTLKKSGLAHWDGSVDRSFASHRTTTWNTVTHYVTLGAETPTVIGVGLVLFVILRLRLGRWRESIFIAVALLGEVSIFASTTLAVDRARPLVPHLDEAPPTSSFPSGHTAASVALYGGLAIVVLTVAARRWPGLLVGVLAVAMPVAVGLSRIYRGMHFPTDVISGALLALIWLAVTARVVLGHRR
jgi:membrane-associated phospholipid phosphatase